MDGIRKLLLVVDDEKPLANALQTKISHEGLEAKSANSGEEALRLLRSEKFDLLLLDLVMVKVDGFHVLEAMNREGITVPTIVLSNLGDEEVKSRVQALGAKAFLVKAETPMSKVVEYIQKELTPTAELVSAPSQTPAAPLSVSPVSSSEPPANP